MPDNDNNTGPVKKIKIQHLINKMPGLHWNRPGQNKRFNR